MSMNFASHFGADLENMIRLKVSLGGAESTYLDRAQNFDRFCLEKYPDADCLTEPLALPASLSAHRILCVRWSAESNVRRSGRFLSSDTAAINDGNRLKQKRGATCSVCSGGAGSSSF